MNSLAGIKVQIMISDPWDFVADNGSGPHIATIIGVHVDSTTNQVVSILVKLEQAVAYEEYCYQYFVAKPRYENHHFDVLMSNQGLVCGLTGISEEKAFSLNPFELSPWRGGLGLIGVINLAT